MNIEAFENPPKLDNHLNSTGPQRDEIWSIREQVFTCLVLSKAVHQKKTKSVVTDKSVVGV